MPFMTDKKILNAKPCPFCGSTDIRLSLKKTGRFETYYHATLHCYNCSTFGPRVLSEKINHISQYTSRLVVEKDTELETKAINAWNERI